MSEIRATTISDAAGTGPIALTGQSAAKAWVQYSQATPVVNDSFNTSSVTDNATGQFTINFANNMANDDYAASSTCSGNARNNTTIQNVASSSLQIYVYRIYSGEAYVDNLSGTSTHGDLA